MVTVGQVGIGAWGQNIVRTFSSLKGCRLKTCCDINPQTLSQIQRQYKNKIITTPDFKDLLNDPEIDAIAVTAPAVLHYKLALQALNAGKHVFVEKPLCLNIKDAEELIKLARKNDRILMVGHLLLYHPAVKKLKQVISAGELGNVYYIYSTRVNLGKIRKEESALWSLTAHDISVALFLLEKEPIEVTAKGAFYLRDRVEDIVFVTITFQNKTIVHIHASWLDPHKMRKFTVVGDKKMAVFDDMEPVNKIKICDKGVDRKHNFETYEEFLTLRDGDVNKPEIKMEEPLRLECQHFIDCVRQGYQPITDGKNGLKVLRILNAAQESLEAGGKPVKI